MRAHHSLKSIVPTFVPTFVRSTFRRSFDVPTFVRRSDVRSFVRRSFVRRHGVFFRLSTVLVTTSPALRVCLAVCLSGWLVNTGSVRCGLIDIVHCISESLTVTFSCSFSLVVRFVHPSVRPSTVDALSQAVLHSELRPILWTERRQVQYFRSTTDVFFTVVGLRS